MNTKAELIKVAAVVVLFGLLIASSLSSSPQRVDAFQATEAASLPLPMEKSLVPCGAGVTGPCDLIATKAEDIAGVWKQYFMAPFFNAPGGVAYIRFNADSTFIIGDSVENTAKGSKGYTSGWITFDGQNFSFGPVTGAPPPCNVPPIYQMRVLKYGDKPVALRQAVIQDTCDGRKLDVSLNLIWVAPSTK